MGLATELTVGARAHQSLATPLRTTRPGSNARETGRYVQYGARISR